MKAFFITLGILFMIVGFIGLHEIDKKHTESDGILATATTQLINWQQRADQERIQLEIRIEVLEEYTRGLEEIRSKLERALNKAEKEGI